MTQPSTAKPRSRPLNIFMAAGEVSGDKQAAFLAKSMMRQEASATIFGSGGELMREAGVNVRIQTSHLGCVGIQETARFLRPLRQAMSNIRSLVQGQPPDMAVLVDNERQNALLARFLHKKQIPFIYYFPPQVWLWARWRAGAIARRASAIIPAFPEDARIYESKGGRVKWFGHPLVDIVRPEGNPADLFHSHGLDANRPLIAIMPGSRSQEIDQHCGRMLEAARVLKQRHPDYQIILPLAATHLRPAIEKAVAAAGLEGAVRIVSRDIYAWLSRCQLVVVSAGTATLETALLGVPMIVVYRCTRLTYCLARCLVHTRFIGMPNILLKNQAVPELIQGNFTTARLIEECRDILENPARSQNIRRQLEQIRPMLGSAGVIDQAAALVLQEASARRKNSPQPASHSCVPPSQC